MATAARRTASIKTHVENTELARGPSRSARSAASSSEVEASSLREASSRLRKALNRIAALPIGRANRPFVGRAPRVFDALGNPRQADRLAMPGLDGDRREPTNHRSRLHIAHDAALGGDLGVGADSQMIGDARLTAHHD